MSKLLPVFLIGLCLALISDRRAIVGFDQYGDKYYKHKEKGIFIIMTIILAVFVGLRTTYNDTNTYRVMYEALSPGLHQLFTLNYDLGQNPGFWIINIILKTIGFSTQSYLMIYALLTNVIYLWFIKKYSDNLWLSIFLFFTMGCYTFTMAAIKQCIAVAFCLIATDKIIHDKKIPFIVWVLIASTFHPYSLMYFIVPFLTFEAWCNKTYFLLLTFGLIGISLQALLGTVVNITTMLGEEYDATSFVGEGINFSRLVVVWVPVIISFIIRKYLKRNNNRIDNIILNLTILNAEIMFIGLFGTANYFGRLANYFIIFQTLCLPHLFRGFNKSSQKLIVMFCVIGFLLYFYYANVINQNFDYSYNSIPFFEYFKTLIGGIL